MAVSLIKDTQVYQADTEQEAQSIVEEYTKKQYTDGYKLTDNKTKYKTKKVKGDVAEEWYEVSVTRSYE